MEQTKIIQHLIGISAKDNKICDLQQGEVDFCLKLRFDLDTISDVGVDPQQGAEAVVGALYRSKPTLRHQQSPLNATGTSLSTLHQMRFAGKKRWEVRN